MAKLPINPSGGSVMAKLPIIPVVAAVAAMTVAAPCSQAETARVPPVSELKGAPSLAAPIPEVASLTCPLLTVCQVILDEAEILKNVSIGNLGDWQLSPETDEHNRIHIMLKAEVAGAATNMLVFTDRRHFEVALTSPPDAKSEARRETSR